MLQNVLLITIGLILGVLITMIIESSLAINYLNKLRRAEFELKQLKQKNVTLFDEKFALSIRVDELEHILKSHNIPDNTN